MYIEYMNYKGKLFCENCKKRIYPARDGFWESSKDSYACSKRCVKKLRGKCV